MNFLNLRCYFLKLKVPPKDTYYYCELFELPKLRNPVQIIQFEVLINEKTKKNYHHVLVYQCLKGFNPGRKYSQECGSASVPSDISLNCMQKMIGKIL